MTERSTVTTSPYTIGVAPFRPGDEPTFGGKFTEQPEDLNRPDPATCTAEDTAPHAKGLIRVLTDEGEAKGECRRGLGGSRRADDARAEAAKAASEWPLRAAAKLPVPKRKITAEVSEVGQGVGIWVARTVVDRRECLATKVYERTK